MREGLKAVTSNSSQGASSSASRSPRRRRDSSDPRPASQRRTTLEMFDANGDLTEGATTLEDDDTEDEDDEDDLPLVRGKDSAAERIELMERGRASPSLHTPRT